MKRQICTVDVQGRTILTYVDCGKATAVIAHNRPTGWAPGGKQQIRNPGGTAA